MTATTDAPAAHEFIAKTVGENDVVVFMKGFPDQPGCGFSAIVVQIQPLYDTRSEPSDHVRVTIRERLRHARVLSVAVLFRPIDRAKS